MSAASTVTSTSVLRLGTRRSALAMAQATAVAVAIRGRGERVELVGVTTAGDRSTAPLIESGGVGVFVTELRARLLAGEVDLVVHSLKDLPTSAAPDLRIAAVPQREDARDALVARDHVTLAELPEGALVGTGSPRRAAQLLAIRPDLDIRPLRGNVDTRLGKVGRGGGAGGASGAGRAGASSHGEPGHGVDRGLDAIVVAAAGLVRLGLIGEATELFATDVMLPAPGQGALAIECRAADAEPGGRLHDVLTALDHAPSRAAVTAERALLEALEAGCTAPVGAFAETDSALDLHLVAAVVSVDGVTAIRGSASGSSTDAEGIGRRLAAELLAQGAGAVIGDRS